MTSDISASDPYRSPVLPETPYSAPSVQKPGWLTALCVICIVLGVLGLMNGILGLGATIFGKQLQQVMNPAASRQQMPADLQKLQQKLEDETAAIQEQFFLPSLIAVVFKLAVSLLLVAGGLGSLRLTEQGRTLLILGCLIAILFELGASVLQSVVYMETLTVYNQLINGFVDELQRQNGAAAGQAFLWFMQLILYAGMVVFFIIQLVKVAFFTWGALYLRRPAIAALFAPADHSRRSFNP